MTDWAIIRKSGYKQTIENIFRILYYYNTHRLMATVLTGQGTVHYEFLNIIELKYDLEDLLLYDETTIDIQVKTLLGYILIYLGISEQLILTIQHGVATITYSSE